MIHNKSIILLSGGLDSLVCAGLCHEKYNIELALTFDYGQKSLQNEINASKKICKHYNIKNHKVIKLDWLKDITASAIVSEKPLPKGVVSDKSLESVWVPNRNGLFLNIAAAFADSDNYSHIIIGANREEAKAFPDNSDIFIRRLNAAFEYSTRVKPKVLTPLIKYDKNDIVRVALENSVPLELAYSCYDSKKEHCGECESCIRFIKALENNNDTYYKKLIFKK